VGKGCSWVETPLFKGMLVARVPEEQGDAEEQGTADNAAEEPVKKLERANKVKTLILKRLRKVEISQGVDTSDDTLMEDVSNQGRKIDELDKDEGAVLMNEKEKTKEVKVITGDAQVEGRQAEIYQINMDHAVKVLSMQEDESKVQEAVESMQEDELKVQEAVEVVTTAKLITEVVAVVVKQRRRGVVIMDPEEESSTKTPTETKSKDKGKGIMVEEPKPMKKKQQVELDEVYARKLQEEHNHDINWEVAMDHVKQKAKENPLDYFKGMSYDDLRPIFKAKFHSNIKFLLKSKEQIEEEENRAIASINETPTQKAIVPNEDDDVYTEATPVARKVPVADYQIIQLNNKPHFKIIRADETHQLYVSFITLLKNFDREDLESLWNIVKERFSTSKPRNFSDDFLLTTHRAMFGRPDGQDQLIMLVERRYPLSRSKDLSSGIRPIASINKTPAQKAAKRRRLNEEAKDVEELKQHLEIVFDEDNDVYTEATSLARKVLVVDYQIIQLNNKPHFKIIRADETHQLYVSFITLLKNFDREDLESLWNIVKERFSTSKLNNFLDDFLLTTLRAMFERPDGRDQVWMNQRSVHGQAKVKSWKLLESCGVHIVALTTTQLIMLVERRYPLSRFTLDQMLNVVFTAAGKDLSAARQKLMLLDTAAG
nr:hypothetical protein [Tanacetum cinerariifolium]